MSTYNAQQIRGAWRDAVASLWRQTIRDIEPGQPDEREWIDSMWRDLGWGWFIDSRGDEGYDEAPESWCGAGLAWAGRHKIGEFLADDQCVNVYLNTDFATEVLPGTDRLYDEGRWENVGLTFCGRHAYNMSEENVRDLLEPGVICTVGEDNDGSHIIMVDHVDHDGRLHTLECNAYGLLGDGKYGEGIVKRTDAGETPDYDGNMHTVEPRTVSELKMVYPLGVGFFRGMSL